MSFEAPLTIALAWRYLRGRRSVLLQGTTRAATLSILLGVAAMVIAMALMTGYTEDLQEKLIGGTAAIVAYPIGDQRLLEEERVQIEALAQVSSLTRVTYAQGALAPATGGEHFDVMVRGVDEGDPLLQGRQLSALEGPAEAFLGRQLADRMGVEIGDELTLVAVDPARVRFRYVRLRFAETFQTGFSEADRSWLVVRRGEVERSIGGSPVSEIRLRDPSEVDAAVASVREVLQDRFLISDWRDYNRTLFTALRLQKLALFVVLGLIVVVSTFNVASNLIVLTRERSREVGVLSALGLSPRRIRRVFLLCGAFLGGVGGVLGAGLGALVAWTITAFELVTFDDPGVAEIYFISSVPFRVQALDVAAVLGFTLVATLLACWIPAHRAASMQASDALRVE